MCLLLCEHPHVLTLGRSGKIEHLRASGDLLRQMGVEFHSSDRGGDITYHGPGQIVGYPILQLAEIRRDVVWYVRQLEEAMIRSDRRFRHRPHSACPDARASGCIRLRTRRSRRRRANKMWRKKSWARSACTSAAGSPRTASPTTFRRDLRYFDLIVPCGIADRRATSLEKLLGRPVSIAEVAPHLTDALGCVLGLRDGQRFARGVTRMAGSSRSGRRCECQPGQRQCDQRMIHSR